MGEIRGGGGVGLSGLTGGTTGKGRDRRPGGPLLCGSGAKVSRQIGKL